MRRMAIFLAGLGAALLVGSLTSILHEWALRNRSEGPAVLSGIAGSVVCAEFSVQDKGTWPASWPSELEPLRGQSRTLEGPKQPLLNYAIPFAKREAFEAA